MKRVADVTQVPENAQKLILNGRSLTSEVDSEDVGQRSLVDLKILNHSKIMVLGKRREPNGEVDVQLKRLESRSAELEKRLEEEVIAKIEDVDADGRKRMLKTCKGVGEEFMRQLESLDAMRFDDNDGDSKAARKTLARDINKRLDKNEELIKRLES